MAILNVRVNIGTAVLPNTLGNQRRMFVYTGGGFGIGPTGIFGNIPKTYSPPSSQYAYDLNNPALPNAIAVTSFSRVRFSSGDLAGQPTLVGQLVDSITKTFIIIEDDAAPGVPLNRAALEAYL